LATAREPTEPRPIWTRVIAELSGRR
jgi:hypothetical protein